MTQTITGLTGSGINFAQNSGSGPLALAQPPVAAQTAVPAAQAPQGFSAMFNIPTNLFPTSTSTQKSGSSSSSWGGINWKSPFMKDLLPYLQDAPGKLIGAVDNMGQTLNDQYANLMRRGLGPEAYQGTLNQLAQKGMLNSSVAGDSMASATKGISKMIGDQAFDSMLGQYSAQMQVPSILAQLAQLGQESKTSSGSSSTSTSASSNPLAPYELMASLLKY